MKKANESIETPTVIMEDPSMKDLLEKTRLVGRALQSRREGTKPDYAKLAKLLCEFSTANVYLINREGKILGSSWVSEYHSEQLAQFLVANEVGGLAVGVHRDMAARVGAVGPVAPHFG